MKRILIWAVIVVILIVIAIQFVPVDRSNPPITQNVNWDSPATEELARRACFDCHSNETAWPWDARIAPVSWLIADHVTEGRQHLNFSEWDQPNAELDEMLHEIKGGDMPLQSYVLMHPKAKLSDSEREALIAGLTATMQQNPPVGGEREGGEEGEGG